METPELNRLIKDKIEEMLVENELQFVNLPIPLVWLEKSEYEIQFIVKKTTYKIKLYNQEFSGKTYIKNTVVYFYELDAFKNNFHKIDSGVVYNIDGIEGIMQSFSKKIQIQKFKNIYEENKFYNINRLIYHPAVSELKMDNKKFLLMLKNKFNVKTDEELELLVLHFLGVPQENSDEIIMGIRSKLSNIALKKTELLKLI